MNQVKLFAREFLLESIIFIPVMLLIDWLLPGSFDIPDNILFALVLSFIFSIVNTITILEGLKRLGIKELSFAHLHALLEQEFSSRYTLGQLEDNLSYFATSHKMEMKEKEDLILFKLRFRPSLLMLFRKRPQLKLNQLQDHTWKINVYPKPVSVYAHYRCLSYIEQLKALVKENYIYESMVASDDIYL